MVFSPIKIDGRIVSVAGSSLVVTLTHNAEKASPGYSFAVHDGRRYKGELVLEEVRGDGTATATLKHREKETVVVPGDKVSTLPE